MSLRAVIQRSNLHYCFGEIKDIRLPHRGYIFYTGVNWFRPRLERLCVHALLPYAGNWRYAFFFVFLVFY
jgi:hypothetical protein